MTERLADVNARIEGIRQLGAVVNAMTGISASRARQAREQIAAVDSYSATITQAMAQAVRSIELPAKSEAALSHMALVVFCAEQGFVGSFNEWILTSVGEDLQKAEVILVGTRGKPDIEAHQVTPVSSTPMPSHSSGIPKSAEIITRKIYSRISQGNIDRVDAVYTVWNSGMAIVKRRQLFPIDLWSLPTASGNAPLMNLSYQQLMESLGVDYLFAQICEIALHSFAAENETRMASMSAAQSQIERELATFEAIARRIRQEEITAEIIELATGEMASQRAVQ